MVARVCALAGILIGFVALIGWTIGSEALRSLGQPIPMNPLVALLVMACGAALVLGWGAPAWRIRTIVAQILASSAVVGGASRLIAYAAHIEGGFDTLLFRSSLAGNQMAPNTALCLALLGCSIVLAPCRGRTAKRCSGLMAFVAGIIALLSLLGYFLAVLALYQLGPYIPMALNTASAMLCLSAAVLLAQPEYSPVASVVRKWTLERTIATGFTAALAMLCLLSAFAYHSTRSLVGENQLEEVTLGQILELADLVSGLKDAETGQRGYLLTGDEQYLAPYHEAIARLGQQLDALRQSTAQNPRQRERLAQIEPLIHAKLAELDRTVKLRRSSGYDAALAVVKSGEGKRLMEAAKQLLTDMRQEENQLLAARSSAAVASARRTTTVIVFGSSMAVLLVLIAGFVIQREMGKRRGSERAMRDAEERLRMLVEGVQDYAILMLDPEGHVVSWNSGAQRMKGYTAEEIVGQHFSRFYTREDIESGKPARELACAIETGRYEEEGWRVRKDGSRFWVNVVISAVRDKSGNLRGFSKVSRDITERKRAEDEIKKLNGTLRQHAARLEAANKELEAFSYSVSHDLRAPLRSIDGFSLALMEDYGDKLEPEAKDYLQRVRAATQRMAQLIDDLLGLSRVTRSDMSRSTVDLSGMARAVAAELEKVQPDRKVDFVIADGLAAEGDARLLRVVLDNLLGNAWKFTAKRNDARIEFGTSGANGSREFFVRDNGAGFDMAYVHKLFGAFQRLHGNGEFAGTGVGLATVQRIIHRHGGRIAAEGAVDKGATFRFTL